MPFHSNAGYEFSETGISVYAPLVPGVYGIYNGTEWIYVDETQDIKTRLYAHFHGKSDQSARIMAQWPAYFIFEKCDSRSEPARKTELIQEHHPCCNRALVQCRLLPPEPVNEACFERSEAIVISNAL